MATYYSTKHVTDHFKISPETVRNWSKEFAAYLSDTAKPDSGQSRRFTPDDMEVFALIADYKKRGYHFEDAHLALRSGQRGEYPQANALEPSISPSLLLRIDDQVKALRLERDQALHDKAASQGQVDLLKEQLADKDRRIEDLNRQIAKLEVKLDAMEKK